MASRRSRELQELQHAIDVLQQINAVTSLVPRAKPWFRDDSPPLQSARESASHQFSAPVVPSNVASSRGPRNEVPPQTVSPAVMADNTNRPSGMKWWVAFIVGCGLFWDNTDNEGRYTHLIVEGLSGTISAIVAPPQPEGLICPPHLVRYKGTCLMPAQPDAPTGLPMGR